MDGIRLLIYDGPGHRLDQCWSAAYQTNNGNQDAEEHDWIRNLVLVTSTTQERRLCKGQPQSFGQQRFMDSLSPRIVLRLDTISRSSGLLPNDQALS